MELALKLFNGQGLGNQIFCITSLYKLSLLLNRKPVIFNYCNYKGEHFFPINKSIFMIKDNISHNEYEEISDLVKQEFLSGLDKNDHKDFIYSLYKTKNSKIIITGNLQNEFFIPEKEDLLKIFPSLEELKAIKSLKKDALIIHIRGGDYKKTLAKPTSNYYQNCIQYFYKELNIKNKKYIVCDDHDYAKKTLPNIKIISEFVDDDSDSKRASHHIGSSIEKDFLSLIKAKYAIIPASTFSLWARIFAHTLYSDAITLGPLHWYGFRLGNFFSSPIRYSYSDFFYMDKKGRIHNYKNIKNNFKNYFFIKNINLNSKIRTILNLILIYLFRK